MMMSIMIQAMSLITQQVIIIEKHNVEDEESLIPGTILSPCHIGLIHLRLIQLIFFYTK